NPIVFKAYNNEQVVIGEDQSGAWPNDNDLSISRGAISMRNVHHIHIEDLAFCQLGGWLFARSCSDITIKNCLFERARHGAKGGARLVECHHCRITDNTFRESAYDTMILVMSDYNLLTNNTLDTAGHSVLALRGASYNVIRNNRFRNPRQKLVEVYDQKLDTRDSINPSYIPVPAYNATQHNVFENNVFGYQPYFKNRGAQPAAMQYSGQSGIIRNNVFSNPVLAALDPKYPNRVAGGIGIYMRWGGSWTGWNGKKILGEAHEAGFVTRNRIYNNVFRGYDFGQVQISADDAMKRVANPPPMKNVSDFRKYSFEKRYAFEDNIFKNNAFFDGKIVPHLNWTWVNKLAGRPVQVILRGRLHVTYFRHNNFFARGPHSNELIYDQVSRQYYPACSPKYFNATYGTFSSNTQKDPLFVDPNSNNYHLRSDSPMIDAGGFLTIVTSPSGSGAQMTVEDAAYFYDGYDITGEVGDLIRLEGQESVARIVDIDYDRNILKLNRSLTWKKGQGVSLNYVGSRPDVGAFEFTPDDHPSPIAGFSSPSTR
ncbi:MAG: right-handed parallel beta-helix repeat-containing protein, partial [Sedimentisphaerales bacterium]